MAGRLLRDVDAVGMAHSLEVRLPLIDPPLVGYAFSLPASFKCGDLQVTETCAKRRTDLKYGPNGVKRLLFDAFASDLPDGLRGRNKTGFKLPLARWLRTDMAPLAESVLVSDDPVPCFQRNGLRRLWADWQTGRAGWGEVWVVLVLDAWYRQLLIQPGASS